MELPTASYALMGVSLWDACVCVLNRLMYGGNATHDRHSLLHSYMGSSSDTSFSADYLLAQQLESSRCVCIRADTGFTVFF